MEKLFLKEGLDNFLIRHLIHSIFILIILSLAVFSSFSLNSYQIIGYSIVLMFMLIIISYKYIKNLMLVIYMIMLVIMIMLIIISEMLEVVGMSNIIFLIFVNSYGLIYLAIRGYEFLDIVNAVNEEYDSKYNQVNSKNKELVSTFSGKSTNKNINNNKNNKRKPRKFR